jgi:MoxR-like ATPase
MVTKAADAQTILRMIALVHSVPMARHVVNFASRLVLALQPDHPSAPAMVKRYVRFGPSPRGAQALCLAGRVLALLDGRINLAIDDIREIAPAALRHRIILTFDGQIERISPDTIIADALARMTEQVAV